MNRIRTKQNSKIAIVPHLLPVGIQSFSQLRSEPYIYVDKTEQIYKMIKSGKVYFLSRPRRFGKSLLLSTIKELFDGNEKLFRGLWIHDKWDWKKKWSVVNISLGTGKFQEKGQAAKRFTEEVNREAERNGIELKTDGIESRFKELLESISKRGDKSVVLIDEYDKPVLQVLEHTGPEGLLEENRKALRGFYSCLKDASPEFLILTGVARLAKASVFSELNHLSDITWTEDYATLCGITQPELEKNFELPLREMTIRRKLTMTDLKKRFREEYNGFRFAAGSPTVYNPFSTVKALSDKAFGRFWSETGTPEFLVKLIKQKNIQLKQVDQIWLPKVALSSLNPFAPDVLPMLLQTGYVTILDGDDENLKVGFSNREVRSAFVEQLVHLSWNQEFAEFAPRAQKMGRAIQAGNVDEYLSEMQKVFLGIPYQLDDATEARYHGLFHAMSILACCPPALVQSENSNALGRSDLVIDMPEVCWIFEFKRDTDTIKALKQISEKKYDFVWQGRKLANGKVKPVRLVAVTFSKKKRNIVKWAEHKTTKVSLRSNAKIK